MARTQISGSDSPARRGHVGLRVAAACLVALAGLVIALVLALQTQWGLHAAANMVLRLANPWPDSEFDAADARGSLFGGFTLLDLELRGAHGTPAVRVDTLRLEYRWNDLLGRPLRVRSIRAGGVHLVTTWRDSAGFDLLAPFLKASPPSKKPKSGFAIAFDEIALANAAIDARFPARDRDTLIQMSQLVARLRNLRAGGPATTFSLDTLGATALLAQPPSIGFELAAHAEMTPTELRVSTLRLDGRRTRVAANGILPVGKRSRGSYDGIAFHAEAEPLAGEEFQRVLGFAWNPGDLTASLDLKGAGPALALQADAAIGDGRATIAAQGIPALSGPVQLEVRASAHALDIGPLIGRAPMQLELNGELAADVRGADLAHVSGPLSISLETCRVNGLDIESARLDAPFAQGQAAVQLDASVDPFEVSASGTMRPFATPPTYDLSARASFPPLPADSARSATRRPWMAGALVASIRGQGFALDPLVARLQVRSEPDPHYSPLIGAGTLDLSLAKRRADWRAAFDVANGSLEASGDGRLDPTPRYAIRDGALRGVEIAALAGDTLPSRLDTRFRLEGRGIDPRTARVSARLDSLALAYGPHRIAGASATAELSEAIAIVRGHAAVDSADVEFDGSAGPITLPLRAARFEVAFRDLNLARVLADTSYSSALAGHVSANAAGPDLIAAVQAAGGHRALPAGTRADATLALDPARWRDQRISTLEAGGRLDGDEASLTARLESSFGRVRFTGSARPFDATPSARVERLEFSGLDLGALLALSGQHTNLQGALTGRVAGRDSSNLAGDYQLTLDGSRINRAQFDRLASSGELANGRLAANLQASSRSDSVAVFAEGRPFDQPGIVSARGMVVIDDLAELLALRVPDETVHLHFDASLDRRGATRLGQTRARGRIEGRARFGEARLDTVSTEFALSGGVLRLSHFDLTGNVATVTGSGQWATPSAGSNDSTRLSLSGVAHDLAPLAPFFGGKTLSVGTGQFSLTANGTPSATRFSGQVTATRPHYDGYWADSLDVFFNGVTRDTLVAALAARVRARSLVVSPFAPRDLTADARWDGSSLAVEDHMTAGPDRTQEIALQFTPGKEESRVRLERVDIRYEKTQFSLQQPGEIRLGRVLHVDPLVILENGRRCLSVESDIEASRSVGIHVALDSLNLGPFFEILGVPKAAGTMTASGSVTGTPQSPAVDATLHGSLEIGGRKPARIGGHARWREDSLEAGLDFTQSASQSISFEGRLPLRLDLSATPMLRATERPVGAHLEAQRFDFSWFEPLFSKRELRHLRGTLDGRVDVKGDLARPGLSGSLALTHAGIELPALGATFEKGDAKLGFAERVVRLEHATVHSGKGKVDASGQVEFLGPMQRTIDLKAEWRRFTAMNTMLAKVETSGKLTATGRMQAPRLEGDLSLDNSTFYAEAGEQVRKGDRVELSEADRRELQERFGYGLKSSSKEGSIMDSVDASLRVRIGENVWVRRRSDPIVSLEMQGDVRATKQPGKELQIAGKLGIQTGRSYLSFLGRQFEMVRAQVELPGPVDSAQAELEARYDGQSSGSTSSSGGATVTAYVTLDANGAKADLQSEPYMDRASLLNYLATGQTQGEMQSGSAAGIAVGSVLGAVGGSAGRSLGFQVVQVSQDAYGGQTLSAGNYVDPRIYLGFRQPVVEGQRSNQTSQGGTYSTEFEVEVEVMKQLLLNLQGGGSQYRFLLRPRLGN